MDDSLSRHLKKQAPLVGEDAITPDREWEHEYAGYYTSGGVCHIRLYGVDSPLLVVVVTELDKNRNTSITNMAEILSAEILEWLVENGVITDIVAYLYVEHYPKRASIRDEDEYTTVSFEPLDSASRWSTVDGKRVERPLMGKPTWEPIGVKDLASYITGEWMEELNTENE